jgi:hypothetical protein
MSEPAKINSPAGRAVIEGLRKAGYSLETTRATLLVAAMAAAGVTSEDEFASHVATIAHALWEEKHYETLAVFLRTVGWRESGLADSLEGWADADARDYGEIWEQLWAPDLDQDLKGDDA